MYYIEQHPEFKYWRVMCKDKVGKIVIDLTTKIEAEVWVKHLNDAYWMGYWRGESTPSL